MPLSKLPVTDSVLSTPPPLFKCANHFVKPLTYPLVVIMLWVDQIILHLHNLVVVGKERFERAPDWEGRWGVG